MEIKRLVADTFAEVVVKMAEDIGRGTLKTEPVRCKYCGSAVIYKYGRNRKGEQRYLCPSCVRVFLDTDNPKYMRASVKQLGDIIGQYYGGMSLKELRRQFQQQHNKALSRSSFDRWLAKFSKIAVTEAGKYRPEKLGDVWLADECVL